jgi:3-dehydroquinate synthase
MLTIDIALAQLPYQVHIGDGLLFHTGNLAQRLFPLAKRCAVVTDSNVGPLYAGTAVAALRAVGVEPVLITVPAGENSKSFAEVESVCRQMIQAKLDRKAFLVALGGGVIGDLAGFAASIFFRGIPYIQIPTTVLAQVDSSVGGKTGINTPDGKNLIGAFHQPAAVLADTACLRTLPERAYHEGFAEIIKHAAIRDAEMLPVIQAVLQGDHSQMDLLIGRNVGIKGRVVEEDEFETKDVRALLNYGHTIGHAIEASVSYGELLHGEAISLGIRAANFLSQRYAGLSAEEAWKLESLLAACKLPLVLPRTIPDDVILEKLSRDKKFDQGAVRFVLLRALGHAFVGKEIGLQDIRDAVAYLRN